MNVKNEDCTKCGAILTEQIQKVACGNSCNECGRYAYFADEPSYLYLLTNLQLKLHKVGIGTVGKDKDYLQHLIEAGWVAYGLWHRDSREKTFRWEREIFKQLKGEIDAAGIGSPGFIGRSDRDWVESISSQVISITDLARLISRVLSEKN